MGIQSLPRQGSLYGLTLNEVQSHLGEPLHSMNLEELLKGLDDQSLAPEPTHRYPSGSGIQRQVSVTMPRSLVKKTVEEVWRDIRQGHDNSQVGAALGEMTLEDFLVKAGVVPEGTGKCGDSVAASQQEYGQGANWMMQQYQPMPAVDPQSVLAAYVPAGRTAYPEGPMSISPTVGAMSDSPTPGQKRGHNGDGGDKMVERRQKRMIKNRESAARSRARKQAYTNELENKVSRLEEENERLKRQKELDKLLCLPPPEPRHQLRRTSSASF